MLQTTFLAPPSDWRPPELSSLPSWEGVERVAVDIETRDEKLSTLGIGVRRRDCYIVGVSFAIEDGPAHYLPYRHLGGDNLPEEGVLEYLREQAQVFKGDLVGANLGYDIDYLEEEGIRLRPRRHLDVLNAAPLLDELQMKYSLDHVAARLEMPGKDRGLIKDAAEAHGLHPEKQLWKLPARFVGPYATRDVTLPLGMLRKQEQLLEEQDLMGIWDLECRLLPVLVKMRRRGVRVDFQHLDKVEEFALAEEKKSLDEVKFHTGVAVGVGNTKKPKIMAAALAQIGVQPSLTPKTRQPQIDDAFLESIHHPVAAALRRARKMGTLRSTFVQSVRTHAVGDRIHCTFNQLRKTDDKTGLTKGVAYGRLSCVDPNLQQQPGRDPEIGPFWRKVYIADEGGRWVVEDYSQQEPRWTTHYAEATKCAGAAEAAEKYREDPKTDNHTMMTHMVHGEYTWDQWDKKTRKKHRDHCKRIFLGLVYGMGGGKLCRELGLPTEWKDVRGQMWEVAGPEGQAMLDLFNSRAPYLKELAFKASNRAKIRGFVRTVLGRTCHFPVDDKGQYEWTHKALNRIIQGSSADQMKTAMVDADDAGIRIQLQVHDELDFTAWDEETPKQLAEIMVNCVPCLVPHSVDIEVGPSWGEAA